MTSLAFLRSDSRIRPSLPLLGCALLLEAVYALGLLWPMRIWSGPVSPYTHLVGTFGVDRAGALRYVALVLVLFGLYGLALLAALTGRLRPGRKLVLATGALFCATLLFTHPLSSTDIFNYIAGARIFWVHGANPLTVAPDQYPADPFVALVANWRDLPSPYGPLWSLLSGVPLLIGGGSPTATVLAFKGLSVISLLGTAALTGATAERLRPGWGGTAALALAWNPLAVWHAAGNGHNDTVMMLLVVLAAWLLARGLSGPAAPVFVASVLVKFASVLLVPALLVWWLRRGRQPSPRALIPWLGGAALLAVLAIAPFWAGGDTFSGALDEGNYFVVSGPAALRGLLVRGLPVETAEAVTVWSTRLAFLMVYAVLLLRPRSGAVDALLAVSALALAAYLVIASPYFAPWYVLWPLALACTLPWRRAVLLPAVGMSAGAMSVLLWATWVKDAYAGQSGDWLPMHVLSFIAVAVPALAGWLAGVWWDRSTDVHPPVAVGEVTGAGIER